MQLSSISKFLVEREIDYQNSIFFTEEVYVKALEDMAAKKEAAAAERHRRQLEKDASKVQRAQEKKEKQRAKQARAELAKCKKKHRELWSLKNIKVLEDKLHAAIRENAPMQSYRALYYRIIPQVCKNNQRLAIERRRAVKKRGEDPRSLSALEEGSTIVVELQLWCAISMSAEGGYQWHGPQ